MAKKENEQDGIKEQIGLLTKEMRAGFKVVDKKFEIVDKRFDDNNNTIDVLTKSTDKKFNLVNQSIADLAKTTARGFENMQKYMDARFDEQGKEISWIKEILEKHSSYLLKLDQERIFTIRHIDRLEDEIKKVKIQLGLK